MSSKGNDSQNRSEDLPTDPEIMSEVMSSPDHDEDIVMRPTVAYFSAISTSGAQGGVSSKEKPKVNQQARKKSKGGEPTAMRNSLHQMNALAARQLVKELTSSA
ncbi:hypothetical protein Fot_24143 [Forsythia ovata]|uniref:Uncharacterized protein n=1 Tax=Forsythia ovata TaxID=205694 RepID=A0ABD1U6L5_9LAMI